MNNIDKVLKEISDDIDSRYFVCSETNGDSAFIGEIGIYPNDEYFRVAYKDFESAQNFFEKSGRGYKVYNLRDGLKEVFNKNQMIINDNDINETFFKVWRALIG